ncbi:MAG TPA: hypothetical protein VK879_04290 [Candidatus Sulfomarinibacteraceae bacterium]|nr:hypothetical protein [Candidatus Sulfomarinibacteraceae bacterium]
MGELSLVLVGFLLTLFIYSYVVGDNPLYRLAVHLLVGVSAAYAAVIAIQSIFLPLFQRLQAQPTAPDNLLWGIPLFLSLLLLLRWIGPLSWAGNSSVGVLITVGAAVALVGVITGTIVPQVLAMPEGQPVLGLVTALLTACALLYFQFTGRPDREGNFTRPGWQRVVAGIGQGVLMITFGALFAGAFGTSLVVLVERLNHFITELASTVGLFLS